MAPAALQEHIRHACLTPQYSHATRTPLSNLSLPRRSFVFPKTPPHLCLTSRSPHNRLIIVSTKQLADSESKISLPNIRAAATTDKPRAFRPGEKKGFVDEMRFVAMKLHTKDQAKEGEKQADSQPVGHWQPSIKGYLKFLVDSKVVYDTMENIVKDAIHPAYSEFTNTGLERSAKLLQDLEWFRSQGHEIPDPGEPGLSYARYLNELAEKNPPAFICHFYNVYFAHTAGGRIIGKKVADMILDGKELEFYKWDGDLTQLMAAVKVNLNKVAEGWSREEKDRCLKETAKSFTYSGKILQLIVS